MITSETYLERIAFWIKTDYSYPWKLKIENLSVLKSSKCVQGLLLHSLTKIQYLITKSFGYLAPVLMPKKNMSRQLNVSGFYYCHERWFNPRGAGGASRPPPQVFREYWKKAALRAAVFLHTFPYIFSAPFLKLSAQGHPRSGQVAQPPKYLWLRCDYSSQWINMKLSWVD